MGKWPPLPVNHSNGQFLSMWTLLCLYDERELLSLTLTCSHFLLLPTSSFLLPHVILLSTIVCLLSPQLCFLPTFYCFCFLSLFDPPFLLSLCFLLQHPAFSEFICSAEFHGVQIQPWHKACCDLVTSNLSLSHNEILSQKNSIIWEEFPVWKLYFWMRRAFLLWQLSPQHPILCRTKNWFTSI